MALSLHPERLKRDKDVAGLLFKYGRRGLAAFSTVSGDRPARKPER